MSFTLDPEVAEALAPFAAEATGATPPAGRRRRRPPRRAGAVFRHGDTAQPFPDDVTATDHELRCRWW